jgi:hypothetical protein
MKTFSNDYSINEEARSNVAIELYEIVSESATNYYNSSDEVVSYNGESYIPAVIKRDSISYNSELEVTSLTIRVGLIEDPFYSFLNNHFHEEIQINILKYFPYNGGVSPLFSGFLNDISITGNEAAVNVVGIESFLNQTIPKFYYQPACNNTLFDSFCSLTASSYAENEVITNISSDGLSLSGLFSTTENYLLYGQAVFGTERRMIVYHSASLIQVRFAFNSLEVNDTIVVYPGCNKTLSQCVSRFNNKVNFLGFPYIPKKNPAIKVSR